MMPGMGGMDPRQMAMMMKRMGIEMRDIPGVQEVVVRTATKDYVFTRASVSVMKGQGQETWQVQGSPKVVERSSPTPSPATAPTTAGPGPGTGHTSPPMSPLSTSATSSAALPITEEDVKTVMQGAHVDARAARKALEECGGDLAEAIVKLTS